MPIASFASVTFRTTLAKKEVLATLRIFMQIAWSETITSSTCWVNCWGPPTLVNSLTITGKVGRFFESD